MKKRSHSNVYIEQKSNFIKTLISAPFVLFSVLLVTLVFSIIVEFIGMAFIWREQGVMHSQLMLMGERRYLSNQVEISIYGKSSALLAEECSRWVHVFLKKTGVYKWIAIMEKSYRKETYDPIDALRSVYKTAKNYIFAGILMIELFVLRLLVVTLSVPIFFLYGVGAIVDGLVQRDLRKFGGGNESSWLYHKVKRCLKPLVVFSIFLYLSSPISIHPNFVFVPAATLFGLFVFLTASTFKKTL